jgi:hypothetical protein
MPNSYGEILTARGGSYILNDTSNWAGTAYAIVTLEDTVFNEIYVTDSNGISTEVLADHVADKAIAVKAGAIITPMDIAIPFSEVTLTSGSVILVLK